MLDHKVKIFETLWLSDKQLHNMHNSTYSNVTVSMNRN